MIVILIWTITCKRKCKEGAELEDTTTVVASCKMARVSEEEDDNNNALRMILSRIKAPRKHAIVKDKKVTAVALLLSTTK